MVINEQMIEFVKTELANLRIEKSDLEQKINSINEDIFALEHLLNRVNANVKKNELYTSNEGMVDDSKITDDEDIVDKVINENSEKEDDIIESTNGI